VKNNKEITYVLMSGWARSGAALSSSILNAHPDVTFSTDIVKYLNFCYKRYPDVSSNNLHIMLEEMKLRLSARFSINLDVSYCVEDIADNISHSNVYSVLMNHIVSRNYRSKVIGEYEGVTWSSIPFFLDNVKNSKAMMIVRDPRDVLVSFKKNTIAPNNDYLISVFNSLSLMTSWLKYEEMYPDEFYGIRFEYLKNDKENVVRNMCDFLDIRFKQSMLNSENWTKLHGNSWAKWENHDSSSFSDDGLLKKNPVGRWKSLIDPVDHFICEFVAGDIMKLFGMDLEFDKPTDEIFEVAIEKLMSSTLLKKSFLNYLYYKKGSEKYPLNPFDPNNWDKRFIDDFEKLKQFNVEPTHGN